MGERLSPEMRRLLEERRLVRYRISRGMILKELEGARYDLERARKSLKDGDYKWATIQAYYSMFYAARALLYSRGFREKSHRALLTALRELFVRSGQLDREYHDDLRNAMDLREEADYGMVFSGEGAKEVVEKAKKIPRKDRDNPPRFSINQMSYYFLYSNILSLIDQTMCTDLVCTT